jgi:hypothetical protein
VPLEIIQPFQFPTPQANAAQILIKKVLVAVLDDGNRLIQAVTHKNFHCTNQTREYLCCQHTAKNNADYKLPFVLA